MAGRGYHGSPGTRVEPFDADTRPGSAWRTLDQMGPIEGAEFSYRPAWPVDLRLTLAPLVRGPWDPTIRLEPGICWRATRTGDGPGAIELRSRGSSITARAWGPGAERLLADLPRLLGEGDDPGAFRPRHPILGELARRMAGMRFGATGAVFESLLPTVLEQKVVAIEARRAYRSLVRRYGQPAPGPLGLLLPPAPETLARLPYETFHPFGVERRRADAIRRAAALAPRLEEAASMGPSDADRRLRALPGIGAWTSAEVRRTALGDPDAVSVGDYHLPHLVSWALAGEARGNDRRMLELLGPYRGQRGRVQRLLEASGIQPPRFGPHLAQRRIQAS
jgi:3-methyladenine DNA glycosylase/8-oxoguanine DNA glycosylase